jgi:hypothetical protein
MGFGFATRFIDHLYTPLATTSNYSAIANKHTLLITTAHAKSSQFAFTSRFLVTNLNNEGFSASVLMSLCPANIAQLISLSWPGVLAI